MVEGGLGGGGGTRGRREGRIVRCDLQGELLYDEDPTQSRPERLISIHNEKLLRVP